MEFVKKKKLFKLVFDQLVVFNHEATNISHIHSVCIVQNK